MKNQCKELDCQKEFEITEAEKSFYESRDYSLPKRCKDCRAKRKQQVGGYR